MQESSSCQYRSSDRIFINMKEWASELRDLFLLLLTEQLPMNERYIFIQR